MVTIFSKVPMSRCPWYLAIFLFCQIEQPLGYIFAHTKFPSYWFLPPKREKLKASTTKLVLVQIKIPDT